MKVLLSWLRELAPFDADPELLGDTMSDLGMAVEEMTTVGEGLDGVVVARIVDVEAIEGADRIRLARVDPGDGNVLPVVCGAPNIHPGAVVPFAPVGTVLPGDFAIGRRKMRGQWSEGMLCSPRELGLGDEHGGILLLGESTPVGQPLREALGIEPDVVFDLEINPNRPDAMSVAGVARDVAARLGVPFSLPEPKVADAGEPIAGVSVEIADPDACGRFQARLLRDVTVGEAPAWMAYRLTLLGMRPINALVDISNYVMLELGQPNHPYDAALLPGGGFRIRRARPGERLVTLDDVTRELTADDLLICGADDTPVGIAGVMGGASCEISAATTEVALEMAWFAPMMISRTSRRLGLRTEASARFEKGCDPEVIDLAAARFCELAAQLCGAAPAPGAVDARGSLPERPPVRLRTTRVNDLLGTSLDAATIGGHLRSIGFDAVPAGGDHDVVVPSWRFDSSTEIDLVEEVARLHGYSRIAPQGLSSARTGRLTPWQQDRRALRNAMVGLGLSEAMPLPFLAPGALTRSGLADDGIELANPLVAAESILRTSLRPGLLAAVAENAARRDPAAALFEIGHVFGPPDEGDLLPDEREHLGVLRAGADATAAVEAWLTVVATLALDGAELTNEAVPGLHPTRSGRVRVGSEVVAELGEIDPAVLAAFDIAGRVAWLQVDLTTTLALPHGERPYRPVSRFPSADLDLAFEVDEAVPVHEVERVLRDAAGELLEALELFDVFRGPQTAVGRRSLAFALRLAALDRTLSDSDVQEVRNRCIAAVESSLPATLRA
jgi:phenylalanyl-tRNA synthetase beta chain